MGKRSATVVLGFIVTTTVLLGAGTDRPVLRLDGAVVPKQYRLDLTVVPDQKTFQGSVDIDVQLSRASTLIWLNASGLDIEQAVVRTSAGVEQTARPILHENQFLGLETSEPVPPGPATLKIRYKGAFKRNSNDGLFTREDAGDWYAYTDFEPLDARSAFPCFDEPIFRAEWHVTLHVPAGLKAFANSPAASESPDAGGLKTVRFKPTPPISTYLVAFAVGPFDVVDAGSAGRNRTPLRIIVPKGRAARTTFARKVTPKIVEELEKYFGIPYPFEKLDQIAFPFVNAGAMENVGLITYGEVFLAASPQTDNLLINRGRAAIIAH